ncbi:hypothetical protein V2G26_011596 [Clonostachys chloroleuca]
MLQTSRIMLSRAAAPRRAALTILAAQRLSVRQVPSSARQLSLLPWRKNKDPSLPIYFPKPTSTVRRSPWKKLRYAVITAAVYYFLFQVYMSVVLDPLFDWAETEWENLSEKEKMEMEQEEDEEDPEPLLFLPFPFTTKKVKQPPYRGSDPEWAGFLKISKDQAMQKSIKGQLADIVRQALERHPSIISTMGGKNIRIKRSWLDILYPPAPPPKHYVSGLIVDWDGLFWGDRPIDTSAALQLDAIMYPKAVAMSAWSFWNVLFQRTKVDISKALGLETEPPAPTWQSVMLERSREAERSKGNPSIPGPDSRPTHVTPPSQPPPNGKTAQDNSSQFPVDFAGLFRKPEGEVRLSPSLQHALHAASLTLAKHRKPIQPQPTRGCVRVDGLVELLGPSAVMTVAVVGWFDPQQKRFVSTSTEVKHVIRLKQRPLGGP